MVKQIKVVPAILAGDPRELESMVQEAEIFADYAQFDFMDGRFVPSRSITYQDLMAIPIKFSWEAHLMVECPQDYLDNMKKAGAKKAVFHYESTTSPKSVISRARELGMELGLAINPETTVTSFLPLVDDVNGVLFLTVQPGFYESKFIPEVLDKVAELRQSRPTIEIGVDGGIKKSNIVQVVRSGVDVVYVGSAIFLQPKPAQKFYDLVALTLEASITHGLGQ